MEEYEAVILFDVASKRSWLVSMYGIASQVVKNRLQEANGHPSSDRAQLDEQPLSDQTMDEFSGIYVTVRKEIRMMRDGTRRERRCILKRRKLIGIEYRDLERSQEGVQLKTLKLQQVPTWWELRELCVVLFGQYTEAVPN
jgi:hypothetical protein